MATPLKRIIKDYNSLEKEHIDLITKHFPEGFENDDLVSFTTPKGQFIKALEIRTAEAIYLFKIAKNMKVDDENAENEGMGISEFDNYKGGDDEDEEVSGEDDEIEAAEDVAEESGADDED
ncbi:MAG: hypothetical protein ACKVOR_11260 [Flavobacteriales bacterium]